MKLGKMLKQARNDNKLTMDELAEKLNKKYSLNINVYDFQGDVCILGIVKELRRKV